MSRINTNVSSMLAQRVLGQQNQNLQTSLERLSTGLRINRGKDDPAGLIASENLRAEKAAITSAIGNAERADQVVNIAEGGLVEVSNLLTELESLVDQSANETGLSAEEKEANQLQIDSILQTIDRIANDTSFQGSKLLNGNFSFTTDGTVNDSELSEVKINAAKVADDATLNVAVDTVTSAQTGQVFLSTQAANSLDGNGQSLTIEVAGTNGVQQFSFASGTSNADIATAINGFKDVTGVSATANTNDIQFDSTSFGSSQFVSVSKISGDAAFDTAIDTDNTFATGSDAAKDSGRDAVVTINGQNASVDGLTASISSSALDVEVTLTESQNTDGASSAFDITGGGAQFSLSPRLDLAGRVSIGIDSVTTGRLGSNENGLLSELGSGGAANVRDGDVDKGQRIIRDAIGEINGLRGRLGAFQKNTIAASVRSLGVALENTAAAESQIRDTDFAEETSNLTRAQILQQAASNSLALANNAPQSVLSLLG